MVIFSHSRVEAQLNGPEENDAIEIPNSLIPTPPERATI